MQKPAAIIFLIIICACCSAQDPLNNQKIDGYRGIWFELNQKYEYGDKYSGGLATYTAKHNPLAIYAAAVNKTYFVYGGTTRVNERHLLCMVGVFDHRTKTVSKPMVAYDKINVDDPHDNPAIMIDTQGYIWIFVSGRGKLRKGIKLKSNHPYSIDGFSSVFEEEFTYPQIWNTAQGFFHFFTKYTGLRELYYETSLDGSSWTEDKKLAAIKGGTDERSGHYQLSNHFNQGQIIGTFFNRHINGDPDTRTDLYYMQTKDFGKTWITVNEVHLDIPVEQIESKSRVKNYADENKNLYLKDMGFDHEGHPACLYLTSFGHEPGPQNAPYEWWVTHWDGKKWNTNKVAESDHNYDMGSLFIHEKSWQIVAPTENPPQKYSVGGEIAIWSKKLKEKEWHLKQTITKGSKLNHSYVRRPVNYRAPFCFFWATGDPNKLSISELYFGDFKGRVWKLPYDMTKNQERPKRVKVSK